MDEDLLLLAELFLRAAELSKLECNLRLVAEFNIV